MQILLKGPWVRQSLLELFLEHLSRGTPPLEALRTSPAPTLSPGRQGRPWRSQAEPLPFSSRLQHLMVTEVWGWLLDGLGLACLPSHY